MAIALRRPARRERDAGNRDAGTREDAAARVPRHRVAAARGAWAVGSVLLTIARLVRLITGLIVLVIVVGIVLKVTSANAGNVIVRDITDVAKVLVGPFKNVFSIKDPKVSIAVNWGLAALVWLIVGGLIARVLASMAPEGVHPSKPVT